jgi:hypothetical protein
MDGTSEERRNILNFAVLAEWLYHRISIPAYAVEQQ